MRELQSSGQIKVQRMLNVPERSSVCEVGDSRARRPQALGYGAHLAFPLINYSFFMLQSTWIPHLQDA
jgi:hypothetical protein